MQYEKFYNYLKIRVGDANTDISINAFKLKDLFNISSCGTQTFIKCYLEVALEVIRPYFTQNIFFRYYLKDNKLEKINIQFVTANALSIDQVANCYDISILQDYIDKEKASLCSMLWQIDEDLAKKSNLLINVMRARIDKIKLRLDAMPLNTNPDYHNMAL